MPVLISVVGALLVTCGCGGRAIVPASFETFNSKDGSFKVQYPAKWEADGGGRSGYYWAKFSSGNASITVDTSAAGSLIADIAKMGMVRGGSMVTPEDLVPVAVVHETERQGFEESGSVKEQKPAVALTGFGDSRKSEYTGKTTFGGSIHGYRVTALSSEKRIRVVCQCPESEWAALKPAFDKVIESVTRGTL